MKQIEILKDTYQRSNPNIATLYGERYNSFGCGVSMISFRDMLTRQCS
jgi:hypothetical protein